MTSNHPFQTVSQLHRSDWLKSFANESDRGTVLIIGEMLSTALELLLKHVMPNEKRELFNVNSALADFSARIDVAFAFGLIAQDVYRDLHLVRKIRNEFAHGMFALSFESLPVANRIQAFVIVNELIATDTGETPPELEGLLLSDHREPLGSHLVTSRDKFLYEFIMLMSSIDHRAGDEKSLPTFEEWREDYNFRTGANRKSILSQLLGA